MDFTYQDDADASQPAQHNVPTAMGVVFTEGWDAFLDHVLLVYTGSFSKAGFSQGAVNQLFFGLFCCFLDYFHSKIWAPFHFGTFEPYKQEKS